MEPAMQNTFQTLLQSTFQSMDVLRFKQFNDLLDQFLTRLGIAFKNFRVLQTKIQAGRILAKQHIDADPSSLITSYYNVMSAHVKEPTLNNMNRDVFIINVLPNMELFALLDLPTHWPNTPETTKSAIWQYCNELWKMSKEHGEMPDRATFGANVMQMVQDPAFQNDVANLAKRFTPLQQNQTLQQNNAAQRDDEMTQ